MVQWIRTFMKARVQEFKSPAPMQKSGTAMCASNFSMGDRQADLRSSVMN